MKLTTVLLLLMTNLAKSQTPTPSFGKIVQIENFKSAYIKERNISIWLPENYNQGKSKFSVLYMHDGQMLFDSNITWNKQEWKVDETITELIRSKKITNTIVVGIWNGGSERHNEYTPQKPFESLPLSYRDSIMNNGKRNNGAEIYSGTITSDAYLKFIVQELKPFIDKNYRTKKDLNNTFIAGSSMGGLISLYAICEYPEIFGGAACLSTHWPVIFSNENNLFPDAINNYLLAHLPSPKDHKIYFDLGDQTLDAMYKPYQKIIDETMKQKGFTSLNWETLEFIGDDHSERSWARRFHLPLKFLLSKP